MAKVQLRRSTISTALLLARLLLAVVFVAAGAAKLADRAGSRQAVAGFGVPSLATPLATLLPLAELAVAAALIPAASAWWGALGALALLLLFVAGIGINLARGRNPDCHCFGHLHSAPAGWRTLARNGALAAIAGFVLWEGRESAGPSAVGWLGALSVAQLAALIGGLVLLGLLGAQWWFLLHLLRQNGRLFVCLEALEALAPGGAGAFQKGTQRAGGLPVGEEAPPFALKGLHGETLTLGALRSPGKPVMLFFTDPNCGPCTAMLPKVGRWQEEHQEKLTIALVSRGGPQENRAKAQEHGVGNVMLQEDWEVSEAYRVVGTPSAVLVTPEGKVGSPVFGGEDVGALLAHAVGERAQLPVAQPQA
jgi:peroxiredoxin